MSTVYNVYAEVCVGGIKPRFLTAYAADFTSLTNQKPFLDPLEMIISPFA